MSLSQLRRTVARIADQLGIDVRDEADVLAENQAEGRDRAAEAWLTFREAAPSDLHARLDALLSPSANLWRPFKIANDGIAGLVDDVRRGWFVSSIPAAVIVPMLDHPLSIHRTCSQCQMRLPGVGGIWRRHGAGSFWQGVLVPFVACPACGGAIDRGDVTKFGNASYLPPIAPDAGQWTFQPNEWLVGPDGRPHKPIAGTELAKLIEFCNRPAA